MSRRPTPPFVRSVLIQARCVWWLSVLIAIGSTLIARNSSALSLRLTISVGQMKVQSKG